MFCRKNIKFENFRLGRSEKRVEISEISDPEISGNVPRNFRDFTPVFSKKGQNHNYDLRVKFVYVCPISHLYYHLIEAGTNLFFILKKVTQNHKVEF